MVPERSKGRVLSTRSVNAFGGFESPLLHALYWIDGFGPWLRPGFDAFCPFFFATFLSRAGNRIEGVRMVSLGEVMVWCVCLFKNFPVVLEIHLGDGVEEVYGVTGLGPLEIRIDTHLVTRFGDENSYG